MRIVNKKWRNRQVGENKFHESSPALGGVVGWSLISYSDDFLRER